MPMRFQGKFADSANAVGGSVALDFGYLLFHMPDYSQEEILKIFPQSHPYILPLHCIRDLTAEKVAKFFRRTLILEIEERKRLLELAKDRLVNRLKIGCEGWLEEGIIKGRQEVALRMLERGMSIAEICSITKLSRSVVNRLGRESGESDSAQKRSRARKQA